MAYKCEYCGASLDPGERCDCIESTEGGNDKIKRFKSVNQCLDELNVLAEYIRRTHNDKETAERLGLISNKINELLCNIAQDEICKCCEDD